MSRDGCNKAEFKGSVTVFCRFSAIRVLCTGYVLSCLPFMSEECLEIHEQIQLIKNLKLAPDFIINIKVILLFCLGL